MIFEVTPEHIKALNDNDLRTLVSLLVEQEAIKAGHSPVSVTSGGDQNANDGGIDVRIELGNGAISGYVPRSNTGFQVKAEDMNNQKVRNEMRPKNILRSSIIELAVAKGAYIIVSSKGSVSDTSLIARRNAMSEAVSDVPNATGLHVDFYDRCRMATWVNQHPGMITWVRFIIGQPISGWRPFGDWSSSPGPNDEPYLIDDHIRVVSANSSDTEGIKALDGIQAIRKILSKSLGAVRLVGLSGVGKTRFAQALFDQTLGEEALNQRETVYTDLSESPNPMPLELLSSLQQLGLSCILIVDNCGTELHAKLVTRMKQMQADVRLLTIEYDVSDDQPEGTDTFKLEPASSDTVEKVVKRRYPKLSSPEIQTIAKFSEGNSRIALALADTAQHGESLANVKDSTLIERLFRQKHENNPQLARAAAVFSLVYSFNGENLEGADSELKILADLAELSVNEMYTHVAELYRRQLVQKRSEWRAVLPHALAHKLAKKALQDILKSVIQHKFVGHASERLLKSFSRRLGYLHDSMEAQAIAKDWLSIGGILGDISKLDSAGWVLLENIAPINPQEALKAIASAVDSDPTFISEENYNRDKIVSLLRSLAYDPSDFDEAVSLIVRFTGLVEKSHTSSTAINVFNSFFTLYFSGTNASVEQRANFLFQLANNYGNEFFTPIIEGLNAMLKCHRFSSSYSFDFGARKRDYGIHPKTDADVLDWYKTTFALVRKLYILPLYKEEIKRIAASQIKLMSIDNEWLLDELIDLAEFMANSHWPGGWVSLRATARQAKKDGHKSQAKRLNDLAAKLAPNSLADKIETYVIPEQWGPLDIAGIDDDDDKYSEQAQKKVEQVCSEIGIELSNDIALFSTHLSAILESSSRRIFIVAKEIGNKAVDIQDFWNITLEKAMSSSNPDWAFRFVSYFLTGIAKGDKSTCDTFLDHAFQDTKLHPFFVHMQVAVGIDERGIKRLIEAAELDTIPVATFSNLSYGRCCDNLSTDQMRKLITAIAEKKNGLEVALNIFYMRLLALQSDKREVSEQEKSTGQLLLSLIQFDHTRTGEISELAFILKCCLTKHSEQAVAEKFATSLLEGIVGSGIYGGDYSPLISELIETFPRVVLDVFVDSISITKSRRYVFRYSLYQDTCPLVNIPHELAIEWALEDPDKRFLNLAQSIRAWEHINGATGVEGEENGSTIRWTKLAMRIMEEAPTPEAIASQFLDNLLPSSWGGNLSDILQSRLPLIHTLSKNTNPAVSALAGSALLAFQKRIVQARESEAQSNRIAYERFEY